MAMKPPPTRVDGETLHRRMQAFQSEVRAPGREHVWTFTLMYRLSEENAESVAQGHDLALLDRENLVMAGGPVCYRCEAPTFNKYPCPGYRDHARTDEGHIVVTEADIVEED